MEVTVYAGEKTYRIEGKRGDTLLRLFSAHGIVIPARCGGNGTCGKCKVRLVSGRVEGAVADENGEILSCRARIVEDCAVRVRTETGRGLDGFRFFRTVSARGKGLGAAFDVGTTTLAACLVSLETGEILARTGRLNPQSVFGSDVISRIHACADERNVRAQFRAVTACAEEMLAELLQAAGGGNISRMTVAGNPAMLHLFCGVNPAPLGVAPFTPVFLGERVFSGEELGLSVGEVVFLPSISSFVGADVTADLLSADLYGREETALLADLGTNGEIVLKANGALYCTSTAAGPALEGACIACGTGGVAGAIDGVGWDGSQFRVTTIGGKPPVGICGCGLADAVALLLDLGRLDESGYLDEERVYLTPEVYLSRADIRQFQLAKGAVRAGIETLLKRAGVSAERVSRVLLAGGLGYYVKARSAARTGLIPPEFARRAHAVGNGSLYGAYLALCDASLRSEAKEIAARCETVDLSADPFFTQAFTEGMFFDE